MTRRVSAREARAHFAELTDQVKYTGEPVVIEKQGRPFVAMIPFDQLELAERALAEARERELIRLGEEAAAEYGDEDLPSDEEIVAAVKRTRREIYRERYGGA